MNKNKALAHGSLAALAAAALLTVTPALAQHKSEYTPPAQTYQNNANTSGTAQSGMQGASTEPLSQVQNAKTTLASAQVKDSNGQQIGQVQSVHTGTTGKPTKIDVSLTSNTGGRAKTVAVKASQLKYDQNSNTLITNLTANQLQAMPAASSTSM